MFPHISFVSVSLLSCYCGFIPTQLAQPPWGQGSHCGPVFFYGFYPGVGTGLVNGRAGKGREREKSHELGLDELERALGWSGLVGELLAALGGIWTHSSIGV